MNENTHTPEPWEFHEWNTGINNAPGFGLMAADGSLGVTVHTRRPKGDGFGTLDCTEQAKANAARIVGCVNACAGINPEAVPEMVKALELFVNASRSYPRGIADLMRAQDIAAETLAKAKEGQP